MKKLLTLLFIVMPLMALAWGSAENEYRVTFVDGRIAEPIYTKSYTSNWEEEKWKEAPIGEIKKMCCQFYFNEPSWLEKNLKTVLKCGVKDYLSDIKIKEYIGVDGYITLKNIVKIEQIK